MTINYDKVQAAVKALGVITDNDAFLEGFLSAFNFPKATYDRLKARIKSGVNQGLRIQGNGGIYFLSSTVANLNSELNILKKNNDLRAIREAFIVIANETDIFAFERESGDMLATSKNDLHKHIEFFFPLLGIKPDAAIDEMKSVDNKVGVKFAELFNELCMQNHNNHNDISELLYRLLFCCFADSIGVLTNGGLRTMLSSYTDASGSDTSVFFCNLFEAVKSESRDSLPGYFFNVNYVDARLFGDSLPLLDFSRKARSLILDLMGLDWSEISPDILGALIQSIVRPGARKNYTSSAFIQKVIGPLFMDELYRSFERAKSDRSKCEALLERIRTISIFDPSSGTGNFLLETYKELSKLAKIIMDKIKEHESSKDSDSGEFLHLHGVQIPLSNFRGIDDDPFSCAIARLGFLFVVCQEEKGVMEAMNVFSKAIDVLFDDYIVVGNATKIDWESICNGSGETYIIGNPLYSGGSNKTEEQKTDLSRVFAGYSKFSGLDYASCWFLLATEYICKHGGSFAFVTTNSLTQGIQVSMLWPKMFNKGARIKFAHTSFKWKNDARNRTAVTVVVIGVVPNTNNQPCELYTPMTMYEPKCISPYLVPGNIIVQKKMRPISSLPGMVKGNMALYWSEFLLSHEEMLNAVSIEPRIKKFLKKIVGGEEVINGIERWCFWIYDDDKDEAMNIPHLSERIEKVRQMRLNSPQISTRVHAAHPHRYRETRETTTNSLVIPEVSSENREYLQIKFFTKSTIIDSKNYVIYDCDEWVFGVIASKMHNVWIRTVCGAFETRPRYAPRLGYNTFPFPTISEEQKSIITHCVRGVIAARELYPDMTLAQLYCPHRMPKELRYSHLVLDKAIDRCYRASDFISDQERLDCLFRLYIDLEDKSYGKYCEN